MTAPVTNNADQEDADDLASAPIAAVVVSYHTGPLLARCLSALCDDRAILEVVLVDNGNPEGAIDEAITHADTTDTSIRVITGHGNIGFAAACNMAVQHTSAPLILFINPDAVLPDGAGERLRADGAALPRPWLMGAKLVDPDGTEQQGSRRGVLTPWRAFVEGAKLSRLAPNHPYFQRFNLHKDPCPKDLSEMPTLSGACLFLPRADYLSIGGMDERYFLHVEDIDFCLRFTKAGGKVYFNPHVTIVHFKSSSRANAVRIELRKMQSMNLFFDTHFSDNYPRPFLSIVRALLWFRLGLLTSRRAVGRVFRFLGIRIRSGAAGAERAKQLANRRAVR